jgi:hypothetical protein
MLVANVPAPAPAKPPGGKVEFGDILLASLWLIGTLLAVAMIWRIVAVVRNYQDRKAATASSPQGQLSEYRKSFDRGEMTEDEYDKVYLKLTGQPRKKLTPPPQAEGGSGNGPPQ